MWAWVCGLVITSAAGLPITPYFTPRAGGFFGGPAPILGGALAHVYFCWLLGVVVLYFPCRWYAGVKGAGTSSSFGTCKSLLKRSGLGLPGTYGAPSLRANAME